MKIGEREQIDKILKSQSKFLKDYLKFSLWEDRRDVKTPPKIMGLEKFCEEIRAEDPYKKNDNSLFILNNSIGGKQQNNFDVPQVVFIDIDFHNEDEDEKQRLINQFLKDTKSNSLQGFVDTMSKDKYALLGSLSKSGKGIRLVFLIQSIFSLSHIYNEEEFEQRYIVDIHKSNFNYVLDYLSMYGVNRDAKYCSDKSAQGIQQGTKYIRRDGSFVNIECEWMFNPDTLETDKEKFNSNIKINSWDKSSLVDIYKNNIDIFKNAFSSWEPHMKLLTYVLPGETDDTYDFFYRISKKFYTGTNFTQHLSNFEAFKRRFFNKKPERKLPIDAFFRSIGIFIPIEKVEELPSFETEELFDDLPTIPNEVYENLPLILKELTDGLDGRKRDVLFTSILSCISIYFSNVKTEYFEGSIIYNNIYTFVVAKTASGKSITKKASILLDKLEYEHREKYKRERKLYESLSNEEKKEKEPPIQNIFRIGGDTNRPAMIKYLSNNNGRMVIFDTEADSLLDNNGSDYGNLSTIIRKGVGNERWDKVIKSEEPVFIDTLKNNISISGTPDQVNKMIGKDGDVNGTFNRFLYYIWDEEPKFLNPFERGGSNLKFEKAGEELLDYYKRYFYQEDCFDFQLTQSQKEIFVTRAKKNFDNTIAMEDNSVSGIIMRHYLFAIKLMITFACLRNMEHNFRYLVKTINISDTDFNSVMKICDVYTKHSIHLFNPYIPKTDGRVNTKSWKVELFELLPNEFQKEYLIPYCKKYGRSMRPTMQRWLDSLVDTEKLIKINDSLGTHYKKIKK